MKRALTALVLAFGLVALAAQMTGVFIGDRERTLYVGGEPFCLVFPQAVLGGKVDDPGFALAVQGNVACFTAIEADGETRAWLEVGQRKLAYTLKARGDAPSAEIRVLFPDDSQAAAVTPPTNPSPSQPNEPSPPPPAPTATEDAQPATVSLPVPQEAQATVVTPETDPEIQRLEGIIQRLDRILKAQETADARYLPKSVTEPGRGASAPESVDVNQEETPEPTLERESANAPEPPENEPAHTGGDTEDAAHAIMPPTQEEGAKAKPQEVTNGGYDPVADPLPAGVRMVTSLVPGKHSWRITYTLYNDGDYPLITDPSNIRVLFNGKTIEAGALKQRTSSGYAGWVPPGYEEVGSIELPRLEGTGELRLEFDLTRLSPERERITVTRRWKITTMPYVLPNQP